MGFVGFVGFEGRWFGRFELGWFEVDCFEVGCFGVGCLELGYFGSLFEAENSEIAADFHSDHSKSVPYSVGHCHQH